MVSLQTLGCFDLTRNSEDNVVSLGKLTNLRDLHLACSTTSDNLLKKLQCLGSVLSKLCNLKSLTLLPAGFSNANTLETCASSKDISCDFGSVSSPPALLQKLELLPRVCIFSILPKWIGKLRLLRVLKIEIVALFSEDVDILKGLPVLTDLSLYVHTAPAQRFVFDEEGFSVLKNLKFICVAPFITFMEGAMPTVRRLKLGFRANAIKQFSPIDVGFKHLIGLEVFFAKIGGAGPGETGREAAKLLLEEAFIHHPSPPVIDIQLVDFIFDRDIEKQADSRIILPSGSSSHMKDPESSSLLQKPGEEDKKTRTREEDYHIMKQHDEIVEQDTEETHRIQVNESGEVTRKQAITGTSMASSSHIQKPARTAWHALRYKYRSITGTGSKNSSKNATATNTNTFGTKTSGGPLSLPLPPTLCMETDILKSSNVRKFTLSELKASANNFRPDVLLGEGGSGRVYKGWMDEHTLAPAKPGTGMVVAVKWLSHDVVVNWPNLKYPDISNISCLSAHASYLGQLSHPNLVKLIGYCSEDEDRFLVYEFMPKGSLKNHLFRSWPYSSLSWEIRMKVALGAARGLAFLHNDQAMFHRDFRTSSILLDSEYNAKLSDFGLVRHGSSGGTSHVSTRFMESSGYAAPEYVAQGHLTAKSNVYIYGVVLLELLSGLPALDNSRPPGQHNLVGWARPYLTNKRVVHLLDSRLGSAYSLRAARKTAALALQCLSEEPQSRPKMDEVVTVLEGLQ